jgi:RNA polymerase sigma-70 factor (ECF subfamily)
MYNACYRILNNTEEAEDVLQESFISAFKNLNHFRGDSSFGSWLKQIVLNKAINQVKKRKLERLPDDDKFDVEEEVGDNEMEGYPFTVEKVKRAIEMLPDGYRVVMSLYLLEGYDHGEIAEILGISESTSKSQFNRSKKKIKEILQMTYE